MPAHETRRSRRCIAGIVALAATGCVHYRARPIAPEPALAALESRRLDSPELARFLQGQPEPVAWPPHAWDLRALTLAALYYHPDLDVARSQWAAAQAGSVRAGERPNPGLNFGPGYNSTTLAGTITPWILTLALDFTVETGGKRGHRLVAARHLSEAARLEVAAAAWRVRSRVRRSLLEAHAARAALAVLERQKGEQQENVGLLERQLAAGAVSPFEVTQARLALDGIRLALDDARRRQAEALPQLASALGMTSRALDGVTLGFGAFESSPPDVPGTAARRQALLSRTDVLSALAAYEATQAALQLEIARQYPDLHLGPGYQMDQAEDKWTLSLGLTLPLFSRNRGAIAEAEARRAESAARFTAVQAGAIEEVETAAAGYGGNRTKAATAEAMLRELRGQEQAADARWRAGEISRLELGSVRVELLGLEHARLEALIQTQEALGRLEDAMQSPADLPAWVWSDPRATRTFAGNEEEQR